MNLVINPKDITYIFSRSSGPGGQNVNKVSTSVALRFDISANRDLNDEEKDRLRRLAKRKVNSNDELIITCQIYRSQEKNRIAAFNKFMELIEKARTIPKSRRFVARPLYDKEKRISGKKIRSELKKNRSKPIWSNN